MTEAIGNLFGNRYDFKPRKPKNDVQELVDAYLKVREWADRPKEFYKENRISYPRLCKEAKELLLVVKGNLDEAIRLVYDMNYKAMKGGFSWNMRTIIKPDLKVKL